MVAVIPSRLIRHGVLVSLALGAIYAVFWMPRLPADFEIQWSFQRPGSDGAAFDWANRPQNYPIDAADMAQLPTGSPLQLRRIQHDFSGAGTDPSRLAVLAERQQAVWRAFEKSWTAYRDHALGWDELAPQTLQGIDKFGGWGATLVDSLDTIYLMGMHGEFNDAVKIVSKIRWDLSTSPFCSLFETNIRFLGGLLSAYDLSGEQVLLDKALELGHMLYAAFDNEAHMPVNKFDFEKARISEVVEPDAREALAVVGSLSLELTRLSQLTGEPKFYDVVDRIKEELQRTQNNTKLPGMWPSRIDLLNGFGVYDHTFSLGSMSDSAYEYLPKMYALLGGLDTAYAEMHSRAAQTIHENLLFRPMIPDADDVDVLFSGTMGSNGKTKRLLPEVEHLGCFAGGYFALAGKLFGKQEHVRIGEQLARGCAWAYNSFPTGIMPENVHVVRCNAGFLERCTWDADRWTKEKMYNSPPGFGHMISAKYLLRPEAVESLFYLYRITGKEDLQDLAWTMFQAITNATETAMAYSGILSVNVEGPTDKLDIMESFWLAETLKYFYLIFAEPHILSLDDYVFNTEAHPFRLPKPDAENQHKRRDGGRTRRRGN